MEGERENGRERESEGKGESTKRVAINSRVSMITSCDYITYMQDYAQLVQSHLLVSNVTNKRFWPLF